MTGRWSGRSSTARNPASLPSKSSPARRSQSPALRKTKSRSTGLGESNGSRSRKRPGNRAVRESSGESVNGDKSVASGRNVLTRRVTRNQDLSMVAEEDHDIENEVDQGTPEAQSPGARSQLTDLSIVTEEQNVMEDEETDDYDQLGAKTDIQSPGARSQMSGMSGTTAISTRTTHSVQVITELDPVLVEMIPEFYRSACNLLDILAPSNASEAIVSSIVNELKVPGSRRGKKLKHQEDIFGLLRANFGPDHYINTTHILRKLLGGRMTEKEDFRPDAVIHASNLATLIKELLVIPRESETMSLSIAQLDTIFPQAFVSKFSEDTKYGNSALAYSTFALALEIRTQYAILALEFQKNEDDWIPDQILVNIFFDETPGYDPELDYYEHVRETGHLRFFMPEGAETSSEQAEIILERIRDIRTSFNDSQDATDSDDLVDFDKLSGMFPWSTFLAETVVWTRLRLQEIMGSINSQGGIENVTRNLIQFMKSENSQIDIQYETPSTSKYAPQILLAAGITTGEKSLYTRPNGKTNARVLANLKRKRPLTDNPQAMKRTTLKSSSGETNIGEPGPSRPKTPGPIASATDNCGYNPEPFMEEGADELDIDDLPSTAKNSLQFWNASINDKNKENRPLVHSEKAGKKPSMLDSQPGAHRVTWEGYTQEAEDRAKRQKQKEANYESEEESEDEGFEEDRRIPKVVENRAAVRAQSPTPIHDEPSPKRQRSKAEQTTRKRNYEVARRNQEREEAQLKANARVSDSEDLVKDDDAPLAMREIELTARKETARIKARVGKRQLQSRIPWSEVDSAELQYCIEIHGCFWSHIEKVGRFEISRGQVALKDKARNMAVAILKASLPLPTNFENITLGIKELRAIRVTRPNYNPEDPDADLEFDSE